MKKLWLLTAVIASACAAASPNAKTEINPGADAASTTLKLAALPVGGVDVLGPDRKSVV